jgi:phage-related protein
LAIGAQVPKTKVVFYKEDDASVPALDWLAELSPKVLDKCRRRIERLAEMGHELRRPEADFLRDKIYELRVGFRGINYRMLYFFHGNTAAVLAHGIVKENVVPPKEIDLAIERKVKFEYNPNKHTHGE